MNIMSLGFLQLIKVVKNMQWIQVEPACCNYSTEYYIPKYNVINLAFYL